MTVVMAAKGYTPLSREDTGTVLSTFNGMCCRKISRFKLIGLMFTVIVAIIFITVACPSLGCAGSRPTYTFSNTLTSGSKSPIDHESSQSALKYRGELKQRVPQCLIIGVKKAGTGALVQYLNLHPDIKVAKGELNFFDYEDNFNRGLDYYKSFMPYTYEGQITVEKTSNYFHNKNTEFRIHSTNSSMKLILIFREPLSRAVSDYLQRTRKNKMVEPEPFEDLVIRKKDGEINSGYAGIRPSHYYKHMSRWLEVFPLKQFHIIDADALVKSPYEEIFKVESFLGLPHLVSRDRFVFNKTKGFYCLSLDAEDGTRTEKCLSKGKGRKHPELHPVVFAKLIEYFRPLNEQFFKLIGRRFQW